MTEQPGTDGPAGGPSGEPAVGELSGGVPGGTGEELPRSVPEAVAGAVPGAVPEAIPEAVVVTTPPGRRWIFFAVNAGLLVVLYVVASVVGNDQRREWDAGTPVALQVSRDRAAGTVVFREAFGPRSWSMPEGDVAGFSIRPDMTGRLVGDCGCQLKLAAPAEPPAFLLALAGGSALLAVPLLRSRRRLRGLATLSTARLRRVQLTPVWLHRSIGAARFGAVARAPGIPDLHLELVGTPVAWFPGGRTAHMAGPDPATGLVLFIDDAHRIAVASSSPQLGEVGARRVERWSADLARLACPEDAVGSEPAEVGGNQRVRIAAGGPAGPRFRPASGSPVQRASYVLSIAAIVAMVVLRPGLAVIVPLWIALITFEPFLPRILASRWASRPPFADWSDRAAARSAAAAVMVAGLVPVPTGAVGPTGPAGPAGPAGQRGAG